MKYEVGGKVVCIKGNRQGAYDKGRTYTCTGIQEGCEHFPILIMIDQLNFDFHGSTYCRHCFNQSGGKWFDASDFTPLSELSPEELIQQIETPILNPQTIYNERNSRKDNTGVGGGARRMRKRL